MKTRLLVILVGVLLILISCRTEIDYVEKNEESKTFAVFSNTSNKNITYRKNAKTGKTQIDYASGFAYLLQRHDSIHKKNTTGLVNSTNETIWDEKLKQRFIKLPNSAFIEFRIKSKVIVEDNQDRWVVFPKIENGKVIDLVAVVLSKEEKEVHYYLIDKKSILYKDNILIFQNHYERYFSKTNKREFAMKTLSDEPEGPPRDIEEVSMVHINKKNYSTYLVLSIGYGGGECMEYMDCNNDGTGYDDSGGGGSAGSDDPNQNTDPCSQTKELVNKISVQNGVEYLRVISNTHGAGEKGFAEKKDGTIAYQSQTTSKSVTFNDIENSIGGYHNHPESGATIFSVGDINVLLSFASHQNISEGTGNAYFGVVTCDSHYIMRFIGSSIDLTNPYTHEQLKEFKFQEFINLYKLLKDPINLNNGEKKLNATGYEKLFFNTLKSMGLENKIILQKVEGNSVSNINFDNNGKPSAVPCN